MRSSIARLVVWIGALAVFVGVVMYAALAWPRAAVEADGAAPVAAEPVVSPLRDVSVAELHEALAGSPLVLDVREPHEFALGRVADSVLVPLATVPHRAGEFAKDEPVFVVCRTGSRSLVAAAALVAAGFTDVRNVQGGMVAWEAYGLPIQR